jgi:hypothetical protein
MKNVSMCYQKKPIPQLSIFCLIQDFNNYVQINTYWRYIAGNTNYGKSYANTHHFQK